jgi:hypothetical protein
VFHRRDLGVLRGRGARDGGQRLTGRVGHEVKVEVAASTLRHDNDGTSCELLGRRPRAKPERKPTMDKLARAFHILTMGTSFKHSGWCMG